MTNSTLLHYHYQPAPQQSKGTLVFIHGLFGDLNNLGVIARAFADDYAILRVDLRNHGRSFHSSEMSYLLMAQDVLRVLQHLNIERAILVGHSMGGKTAMQLAAIAPHYVEKLIVIDIAPVHYLQQRHSDIFAGLFAVAHAHPATRQAAKQVMSAYIPDEGIQQFMLKSFDPESPKSFRFNLSELQRHYDVLMGWETVHCDVPTLFIKGGKSDYIQPQDSGKILAQFPNASSFTINSADHWVHAEKPEAVVRAIEKFI